MGLEAAIMILVKWTGGVSYQQLLEAMGNRVEAEEVSDTVDDLAERGLIIRAEMDMLLPQAVA